jgi:superfamily I DNA/RNA helicase
MTFDAFAKGLVDRFLGALPDRWRPRPGYEILQTPEPFLRGFLSQVGEPPLVGARAEIEAISAKTFERRYLLAPLPEDEWPAPTAGQWAADRFWQSYLHSGEASQVSFPMLGCLAELLLRINPAVRLGLQLTYSHLFMDEFQDTTRVQYELVRRIFQGSGLTVTAVGDNKQQIMRWANAMVDPFSVFEADFGARRTPLSNNYRSSPELVRIQHVLARALDGAAVKPISMASTVVSGECCGIWEFSTAKTEAAYLARFIAAEMEARSLKPRDFALLVRLKPADYEPVLAPFFAEQGLTLRNEAALIDKVPLQELLEEEVSEILILLLRVATSERAGSRWSECLERLGTLRGQSSGSAMSQARLVREFATFCRRFALDHPAPPRNKSEAVAVMRAVVSFIGHDRLLAAYPAYRRGDWFEKVEQAAVLHLESSSSRTTDWAAALDRYEGIHAVPLMTIHRSKGLEYDTVLFVGLDDRAWWSFDREPDEATAGFFVALTRAKQRVAFTFCPSRGARAKVAPLYELLQSAGVSPQYLG